MAKATVTIFRQMKCPKDLARATGGSMMTEARVHFSTTGMTIHAEEVGLRRLTRIFFQPLNVRWVAAGSIVNTKFNNNYASITIASLKYKPVNGTIIADGTIQDYYALFIGD